jgi:hypothetical protein
MSNINLIFFIKKMFFIFIILIYLYKKKIMACGCKNKNKSSNVVSSYKMKLLQNATASTTNKEKTKSQIREELLKRMRDGMV